jgi:hypothetical protein
VLPEGLDDRFRELRRRPRARAALREECEAAVRRLEFGTSAELWIPPVPLSGARNAPPPRRAEPPGEDDVLAGLDESDRPVLVRRAFGHDGEAPSAVLAHPSETTDDWVIHSRLLTWSGARLEVAGFLTHRSVSHVTWIDHDDAWRPVTFATVGVPYNDSGKGAELAWCEWDDDRCTRVRRLSTEGRGWHASVRVGEYDAAGLAAVRFGSADRAAEWDVAHATLDALVADGPSWQRRRDGWAPDPLAPDDALVAWIEGLTSATERIVAARSEPPSLIGVWPGYWPDARPAVVVAEGRVTREEFEALREPIVDLLPALDEQGLRAWRSLKQQHVSEPPPSFFEALQRKLARLPCPAVVFANGDHWLRAERQLGTEPLPRGAPLAPTPKVDGPPASRAALAALLEAFDLPTALAAEAEWGVALLPGGRGESRLGGPAELPVGTVVSRALTHLGTIALAEVPAFEGRDVLPRGGALAFFADISEDGELWEDVVIGEDDRVEVIHVPAGAATRAVTTRRLRGRRVRLKPVLTLPEIVDGLAPRHQAQYDRLYAALLAVTPGLEAPPHLLLGHPVADPSDPRGAGQVNVFHVGFDEALGFEFLDGGALTFRGDADDVRAGRWDRLLVTPESA